MQIVVLGMHRSGTSLLTSVLARLGCYVGSDTIAVGPWNRTGHWEHPEVTELDDELLAALGANWFDLARLDLSELPEPAHAGFAGRARTIIEELDRHRPWAIKDPRLCSLLPFWRPLLQNPVAILIHRDPVEVAYSLRARDGFPLPFGVALWEHSLRSALKASAGMPRILVRHASLLRDPVAAASTLLDQLAAVGVSGLKGADASLTRTVHRELHHYEAVAEERSELLAPAQLELCAALDAGEIPQASGPLTLGCRELMTTYPPQLRRLETAQAERTRLHDLLAIEAELRGWIGELERAKVWLDDQRRRWEAAAESNARLLEQHQIWLGEAIRDRDALLRLTEVAATENLEARRYAQVQQAELDWIQHSVTWRLRSWLLRSRLLWRAFSRVRGSRRDGQG
jgi:sulfotransferase family protein